MLAHEPYLCKEVQIGLRTENTLDLRLKNKVKVVTKSPYLNFLIKIIMAKLTNGANEGQNNEYAKTVCHHLVTSINVLG